MSNPISRFPDSDPDKLAASVFAAGLMHSFVRREEIVRWADRRIEEMPQPPEWIIDLSLSQNTPVMDLIAHLRRVGDEIDRVSTCEAIYALLPDVTLYSFDQANAFAKKLYRIAYECVGADWKCELLRKADRLADDFEFLRDGYLAAKQSDVVRAVQKFIEEHRDEQIVRHLQPVQWSWQPDSSRATKANVHLIHVGLDSWIIQDGNYADFAVGDVAKFALEFNPLRENNADGSRTPSAEHLKGSRQQVCGRIIFAGADAWVIDTGLFLAYKEEKNKRTAGQWFEGEIYLGIDPFFYFEGLHLLEGMPPLTYSWKIQKILRETTPWVNMKDTSGRTYRTRDETREAFVPTHTTNAWHEPEGPDHYVLGCERLDGPNRPEFPSL